MAILIDEKKHVLVQGITGREGQARTRLMREYGTNVIAGVTPGKGGQSVLGVPVFNTPEDAVKALGKIDISVLFVPAAGVKDAAISAIDAGIKLTVLIPDRVPVWDAMEIAAAAKANGAMFVGPNTLGVLSPGKAVVGMIGGRAESARQWFKPGVPKGVGVISRSGGMASRSASNPPRYRARSRCGTKVYEILAAMPEPRKGRVWPDVDIRTAFENAVEAAKLDAPLTFHDPRYSFASWFMMRGGRLETPEVFARSIHAHSSIPSDCSVSWNYCCRFLQPYHLGARASTFGRSVLRPEIRIGL